MCSVFRVTFTSPTRNEMLTADAVVTSHVTAVQALTTITVCHVT